MPMINCPHCGQLNHTDDREYCKQCGGRLDAPGQTLAPVAEHQHDGALRPWWQNPANRGTVFNMFILPFFVVLPFAVAAGLALYSAAVPNHAEAERVCSGLGYDVNGGVVCADFVPGNPSGYFDYCQSLGYSGGRWPFCLEKLEE